MGTRGSSSVRTQATSRDGQSPCWAPEQARLLTEGAETKCGHARARPRSQEEGRASGPWTELKARQVMGGHTGSPEAPRAARMEAPGAAPAVAHDCGRDQEPCAQAWAPGSGRDEKNTLT